MVSICTDFLVLICGGSSFQNPVSDDRESYRLSVGGLEKKFCSLLCWEKFCLLLCWKKFWLLLCWLYSRILTLLLQLHEQFVLYSLFLLELM